MGFFLNPLFPSRNGSDDSHRIKTLQPDMEDACGLLSHSALTSTLLWDPAAINYMNVAILSQTDLLAYIHSDTWCLLPPEYSFLLFKGPPEHPLLSELFQNLTMQWSLSLSIHQNTLCAGSYPGTLCWWSLRISTPSESQVRLVPHQEHPCLMTWNTYSDSEP